MNHDISMKPPEAPIKVRIFREQHNIGGNRMSAILGAMYPERECVKFIIASDVLKFMRAHIQCTTEDFQRLQAEALALKAMRDTPATQPA